MTSIFEYDLHYITKFYPFKSIEFNHITLHILFYFKTYFIRVYIYLLDKLNEIKQQSKYQDMFYSKIRFVLVPVVFGFAFRFSFATYCGIKIIRRGGGVIFRGLLNYMFVGT